jgi:hypothetical protein
MTVRLVVAFLAVWLLSTLVLARVAWFQRRDERDHRDDRGEGARLAKDAQSWLSSQ